MTPGEAHLVGASQAYDLDQRPALENWTRVPDEQVLRLLIGAKLSRKTDPAPRPCTIVDQIRWVYSYLREHYGPFRDD